MARAYLYRGLLCLGEMAFIPSGTFPMGTKDALPEERPVHEVYVDGFYLDRHEVTNRRFSIFVQATNYKTLAERLPGPMGQAPGSLVFRRPKAAVSRGEFVEASWHFVEGANWRHPEGGKSPSVVHSRPTHPVVQVAWEDAFAFCAWTGGRLPTEAEWERAARGGKNGKTFVWGDDETPGGRYLSNTWQGRFPVENTAKDGFVGTAPVGSYPPNDYGLYDMAGNVWEWTSDWYRHDAYRQSEARNPKGPDASQSFDPAEPGVKKRTIRGGSFLCAASHCMRYRPGARSGLSPTTSLSHTGFRCARDADKKPKAAR